jgi:hypothetical protein
VSHEIAAELKLSPTWRLKCETPAVVSQPDPPPLKWSALKYGF